MQPSAYILIVGLAAILSTVAAVLQRRVGERLAASRWVVMSWGCLCLLAFYLIYKRWPPRPWLPEALDGEPWEAMLFPLLGMCVIWPQVRALLKPWPSLRIIVATGLASLPVMAALTIAPQYVSQRMDLVIGNPVWTVAALLAVGCNALAIERMEETGASGWCLWILVAQSLSVAGILLSCFASFGEWSLLIGLSLAAVAIARHTAGSAGQWAGSLALPSLTANSIQLMHVRDYSSFALPGWLAPLAFLLPAIVVLVDIGLGARHTGYRDSGYRRVLVAGVSAAVVAGTILGIVFADSGSGEDW